MKNLKDINLDNLGNLLKSKRRALGLTQSEVAEMVGLTMQHYSRLERGEYVPSLQTFFSIASALDINISSLNLANENDITSTTFEIVSLLGQLNITKQKAVLSFLKTMA